MNRYCGLLFASFATFSSQALEYLYPVAVTECEGEQLVYVLYQKSLDHLELWSWDPITTQASKALLSSFTPAGLRILTNNAGFSFIDNGRIKVKETNKRSPKSLDIYQALYDIGVVEWIDSEWCYFSAKAGDKSNIYQLHMSGQINCLASSERGDCLYPQRVGGKLFYVEHGAHYSVMEVDCSYVVHAIHNNFNNPQDFEMRSQKIFDELQCDDSKKHNDVLPSSLILSFTAQDFGEHAIAFLHMISDQEGFLIEHPTNINRQDKTIRFGYRHIYKTDTIWHTHKLFNFEIPLHFLLAQSPTRIYESMLPLLPRPIDNIIHYVDCAQHTGNFNLNVYTYDIKTYSNKQITHVAGIDQHCFVPIQIDKNLIFGGVIKESYNNQIGLPCMKINDDGNLCFDMPFLAQ